MADITIVNGFYKSTYNWGAPSCMVTIATWVVYGIDLPTLPTCCSGRPEYAKETSWLRHGGRQRADDFLGNDAEHLRTSMNIYGKYGKYIWNMEINLWTCMENMEIYENKRKSIEIMMIEWSWDHHIFPEEKNIGVTWLAANMCSLLLPSGNEGHTHTHIYIYNYIYVMEFSHNLSYYPLPFY